MITIEDKMGVLANQVKALIDDLNVDHGDKIIAGFEWSECGNRAFVHVTDLLEPILGWSPEMEYMLEFKDELFCRDTMNKCMTELVEPGDKLETGK
jgi:hypothetical protein